MVRRATEAAAALLLAAAPAAAQSIPGIYADSSTAALVALARERHLRQDSLVRGYQALVRTRVDAAAGRSRFARMFPLIVHETAARVTWARPNDLKMDVLGVRGRSAFDDAEPDVLFSRPWFVPRALGDSIRLMGVPETAALHPLAPGAERYYRYAIRDSLRMVIPGRTVQAVAIRVEPRREGPSLVAGDLWVDATSGDAVRLSVTFLGEFLWDAPEEGDSPEDSASARRDNRWAQRFLSVQADLEYALFENLFWMPYRQLLNILVEWDILFRGALPVRAVTTFEDYRINADVAPQFAVDLNDDDDGDVDRPRTRCPRCPEDGNTQANRREYGFDRADRSGQGRWEISYPPRDSLRAYAWQDSLALDLDPADRERIRRTVAELSRLAEDLPDEWFGRPRHSLQWERFSDIVRYNRVQGPSVGLGYELRPGPAFTTVHLGARFGFSDQRPTGHITLRRDAPGGALELSAYRDVHDAEPWTDGTSLGNSFNALFTGHDDADYHLALGASVGFRGYHGFAEDLGVTLAAERHRSMAAEAGWIGGGVPEVRPNPAVTEGDFLRLQVTRDARLGRSRLQLGAEGLLGEGVEGGRAWGSGEFPFRVFDRTGALSLRTGAAGGDVVPQLLYRVGGPETVRGYFYGYRAGERFWSAQLDWALARNWLAAPVVFVDAGGTYTSDDPLIGVGAGASFFGGWMRLNFSKGVRPVEDLRFDLLFRAPR